jgi:hypothetical protein
MNTFNAGQNRLSTAIGRWAGVGPYYAMFPVAFAFDVVQKYCPNGGSVIDPFAGRGSSIYAATTTGRYGYGIEINKVGWLYSKVKLSPAPLEMVLGRNKEIADLAQSANQAILEGLPEFFYVCFSQRILKYLLIARDTLKWSTNLTDATLMAIILIYLHGNHGRALSNQMRQSKAMAPEYSLNWWREKGTVAPDFCPEEFMRKKISWRYEKGIPENHRGAVHLGDATSHLDEVILGVQEGKIPKFNLLFTSPPYYNVTSYHYDQWLRLWMLGESPTPTKSGGEFQNGFWSKESYRSLLEKVFSKTSQILADGAKIVVRTDQRAFTKETTISILNNVFPSRDMVIEESKPKTSQTALFGDKTSKPGEVDIFLL